MTMATNLHGSGVEECVATEPSDWFDDLKKKSSQVAIRTTTTMQGVPAAVMSVYRFGSSDWLRVSKPYGWPNEQSGAPGRVFVSLFSRRKARSD
jgi:hypothetical protein